MDIYLSAPKRLRAEAIAGRKDIRALGHQVLGSWMDDATLFIENDEPPILASLPAGSDASPRGAGDGSPHVIAASLMKSRREIFMGVRAARRLSEIMECDALVVLTDELNHTREAAYGEYVGVLVQGKSVWLVGERYHDLHCFKDVLQFPTWQDFLEMLGVKYRVVA